MYQVITTIVSGQAPEQEPITKEILIKFVPDLLCAVIGMSLKNPGIVVPSKTKDGTCMKLYCLGCKENKTLQLSALDQHKNFYFPKEKNKIFQEI
ncbi:hypothetical protein DSO57_1018467 [Entomophthora muscae]|uniref:Uncharacterized protein n=1 Tax=Entomophthora muscae TaxID=34485 RepID=A0ACC2S6I3_9FUNG|nr:hypothetical protein DSO57_1018467 [Entomophthora muscae]